MILANYKKDYVLEEESLELFYNDNLNSRRTSLDSSGTVVNKFKYSAWGEVTQELGSEIEIASFTGKQYDDTGFIYFNARYYDPALGRFISEDPSRQGTGWYSYCSNNPVNSVDPDGKFPIEAIIEQAIDIIPDLTNIGIDMINMAITSIQRSIEIINNHQFGLKVKPQAEYKGSLSDRRTEDVKANVMAWGFSRGPKGENALSEFTKSLQNKYDSMLPNSVIVHNYKTAIGTSLWDEKATCFEELSRGYMEKSDYNVFSLKGVTPNTAALYTLGSKGFPDEVGKDSVEYPVTGWEMYTLHTEFTAKVSFHINGNVLDPNKEILGELFNPKEKRLNFPIY